MDQDHRIRMVAAQRLVPVVRTGKVTARISEFVRDTGEEVVGDLAFLRSGGRGGIRHACEPVQTAGLGLRTAPKHPTHA